MTRSVHLRPRRCSKTSRAPRPQSVCARTCIIISRGGQTLLKQLHRPTQLVYTVCRLASLKTNRSICSHSASAMWSRSERNQSIQASSVSSKSFKMSLRRPVHPRLNLKGSKSWSCQRWRRRFLAAISCSKNVIASSIR